MFRKSALLALAAVAAFGATTLTFDTADAAHGFRGGRPGRVIDPGYGRPGHHVHPRWPGRPQWHGHWRRPVWYAAPVAYAVARPVAAAPGPCTCLSKEYTPEGAVLFKDRCTNEMAMNPPAAAPQQQQGMDATTPQQPQPQYAQQPQAQYTPQYPPQTPAR